jgi:two-component system sensor histidine kinase VanS
MFLKNKWQSLKVKTKLFIGTSIFLVIAFIILYTIVYIGLPKFFQRYRYSISEKALDKLIYTLENDDTIDLEETLNDFVYSNNINISIINEWGSVVYPIKGEGDKGFFRFDYGIGKKTHLQNSIDIERDVVIKVINKEFKLLAHIPINIKEDTSIVILYFIPIFVIFSVIIAMVMSLVYSRAISRPLIHINDIAKKMANLDFTEKFKITGDDELSQLSNSLNEMSNNLYKTILKLEAANTELKSDIEKQVEYDRQRRNFIATISHELKTPITIISGQLEGMMYNIGPYKDRDKYLKKSYEVTQDMKSLVQEILNLNKFEKHGFEIKKQQVNLSILVNEILASLDFLVKEKNLRLSIDIDNDIIVSVDRELIKKAIINIITNGIKYSPQGEAIEVTLENKDRPKLVVKNYGVFIEESDLKEIFNAFYRVDKSRNKNTGGSGLGLYIVKTILDAHKDIKYNIESVKNWVKFVIEFY